MSRAANLGQNWNNAAETGSRASNSNNPWNSNTNIGGRGLCDDLNINCSILTFSGIGRSINSDQLNYPA